MRRCVCLGVSVLPFLMTDGRREMKDPNVKSHTSASFLPSSSPLLSASSPSCRSSFECHQRMQWREGGRGSPSPVYVTANKCSLVYLTFLQSMYISLIYLFFPLGYFTKGINRITKTGLAEGSI